MLRLEEELIERLKGIAAKQSVPYQALVQEVLWRVARALK